MVRAHFAVDVNIPILTPQGQAQFERSVQREAARRVRKEILTPLRKTLPRRTGALRKSLRATGRPKRHRNRNKFTALEIKHAFYLYFHEDPHYRRLRQKIRTEGMDIIQDAVADALRRQGFR